jgi:hypothetical protein
MKRLALGLLVVGLLAASAPALARHNYGNGSGWNGGWSGYQNQVMYSPNYQQQGYYNSYPYSNGYGYTNGYYGNGYSYQYQRPSKIRNFINNWLTY